MMTAPVPAAAVDWRSEMTRCFTPGRTPALVCCQSAHDTILTEPGGMDHGIRGSWSLYSTVTGYPYLNPLSSLLLTIPLLLTTESVVLAVGRTTADPSMPVSGRLPCVGSTTLAGQLSEGAVKSD
ncbi:hypothetical protein BHM03_00006636 [Ensete ventricosum]|nr:hypothetical protein BHM03_00006636 [Ensete ventricosum]